MAVTITPSTALGPVRAGDGPTRPGRLTTRQEQRQEVVRILTERASKSESVEERERVAWPSGDESIVVVTFTREHIEGRPVFLPDKVTEYLPSGAEFVHDPAAALARLKAEVADLYEKGQV